MSTEVTTTGMTDPKPMQLPTEHSTTDSTAPDDDTDNDITSEESTSSIVDIEETRQHQYVAFLPPSEQFAYAVSQLDSCQNDNVLDWSAAVRRILGQGGYVYMLLSKAPAQRRPPKPGPKKPEAPKQANEVDVIPDSTEEAMGQDVVSAVIDATKAESKTPEDTNIMPEPLLPDQDPHEDYYMYAAPKLGMIVISPFMWAFFEKNPTAKHVIIPSPYGDVKPEALGAIAAWLRQIFAVEESFPISLPLPDASRSGNTSINSINRALDLRVAMQIIGIEEKYFSHFLPSYRFGLGKRRPLTAEARSVVSHVVPEVCPLVENDAVVKILAECLVDLERRQKLPNPPMWQAFLRAKNNEGLKLAMENVKVVHQLVDTTEQVELGTGMHLSNRKAQMWVGKGSRKTSNTVAWFKKKWGKN